MSDDIKNNEDTKSHDESKKTTKRRTLTIGRSLDDIKKSKLSSASTSFGVYVVNKTSKQEKAKDKEDISSDSKTLTSSERERRKKVLERSLNVLGDSKSSIKPSMPVLSEFDKSLDEGKQEHEIKAEQLETTKEEVEVVKQAETKVEEKIKEEPRQKVEALEEQPQSVGKETQKDAKDFRSFLGQGMPKPVVYKPTVVEPIKQEEKVVVKREAPAKTTVEVKEDKADNKTTAKKTNPFEDTYKKWNKQKANLSFNSGSSEEKEEFEERPVVKRFQRFKRKDKAKVKVKQEKIIRTVALPDYISVQDLAGRMSEKLSSVIKVLMDLGNQYTANDTIDSDTAELVITELGHKFERVSDSLVEDSLQAGSEDKKLEARGPVVAVMGHVDHGKTSLLDALRQTRVTAREAGGITQHIGAYQYITEDNKAITFLDTPGHEAFSAMRTRGAEITDIVVLVVAADDSVNAQTVESINHAKAANVPIVVAINKIDKPEADSMRVKTELMQHSVFVEELGGDVLCVEISALKRLNLDKLINSILLQSEIMDLKTHYEGRAKGFVLESRMEKGTGSISTILVQEGELKVGDIFVSGMCFGKVRKINNEHSKSLQKAYPVQPVEIAGYDTTAQAGDDFWVVENEAKARDIANLRIEKYKLEKASKEKKDNIEKFLSNSGNKKILSVIIKADVHGSVEAIIGSLLKIENEEVGVKIVHSATGAINESDINMANISNALVIGFNVRANKNAKTLADQNAVDIRYHSIIYNVIDDVKNYLSGMLDASIVESIIGSAEVREVFRSSKFGNIAGCYVTSGSIKSDSKVKLTRDDIVIYEGNLSQLRRFKDVVKEVKEGYECGLSITSYNDIKVGDCIEAIEVKEVQRTLEDIK